MSSRRISALRKDVLQDVRGNVLEIGFGTGLNLPHYPTQVEHITTVDVNPGMNLWARKRIEASKLEVDVKILSSESLPLADSSFDSVVSTWTLCSIEMVEQALAEVYRVLKPGGKFFFLEHGLHPDPDVQKWQNRFNRFQNIIADGCNINRPIDALVKMQEYASIEIRNFHFQGSPKSLGYMYQGIATK